MESSCLGSSPAPSLNGHVTLHRRLKLLDLSFYIFDGGVDNNRSYLIELLVGVEEAHLVKLRTVPETGSICCLKSKQASKPREMAGFVEMSPVPLWHCSVLAGESTHGGWSGRHVKDRECLSSSWSVVVPGPLVGLGV